MKFQKITAISNPVVRHLLRNDKCGRKSELLIQLKKFTGLLEDMAT
jgi:hypothetical protein